jgi:hypothetical protein
MQTSKTKRSTRGTCGFVIWDVLIAMAMTGVLVMAMFGAIQFNKIQMYKDKERALMMDFAVHYLEMVKGMPFAEAVKGAHINQLYSGASGSARIAIPLNSNWSSLNDTNYQSFHPELVWMSSRNPEMSVDLVTTQAGGADHTKHLQVELRWDPPLGLGRRCVARMDMIKTRDL